MQLHVVLNAPIDQKKEKKQKHRFEWKKKPLVSYFD